MRSLTVTDGIMAAVLKEDEEKATHLFLDHLNRVRAEYNVAPVSWKTAVRFLMARKFDVKRALELFKNHAALRQREGLSHLSPTEEPLSRELLSGKFTILPHRDTTGAAIALFSAKLHAPNAVPMQAVLQAVVFQLDHALSDNNTQRNGLTCIYNMTESSFANFDMNLSKKLLSMLREGYPARLKRVYVVTPPLWFKAMYKLLAPLLKEKIKERVTLVSAERLCRYIPAMALPRELGGSAEVKHLDWLNSCLNQQTGDNNRNSQDLSDEFADSLDALEANRKALELFGAIPSAGSKALPQPYVNHVQAVQRERTSSLGSDAGHGLVAVPSQTGSAGNSIPSSPAQPRHRNLAQEINDHVDRLDALDKNDIPDCTAVLGRTDHHPHPQIVQGCMVSDDDDEEKGQQETKEKHETEPVREAISNHINQTNHSNDDDLIDMPTEPPPKPPRPQEQVCVSTPTMPGRHALKEELSVHQPTDTGMDLDGLVEYVLQTKQSGIYKEYAMIRAEPPVGLFNVSKHKFNLPKNRYADVLCYDQSRVKLKLTNGDPYSDYINANTMDGYMQKNAFIAAQGPLPRTFGDFWRMIWEQSVLVVVMTTRTVERGRLKCGQYWPGEVGSSENYSFIAVKNLEMERRRDYTITVFSVQNMQTGETRRVTHMQFTSWPDFGTPRSAQAMLEFREEVRRYQAKAVEELGSVWTSHPLGPPILVHCSAGIGRTGTFCTLDISLSRLEDVHTVDICNTVRRMRAQRAFSIQTPDQYEFCYFAIIEYAQRAGKLAPIDFSGYDDSESDSD
ncbi:tyrosine-protein phosphatase non-receptor type 9-like isoform X2 [Acanthaster planci]|uniref:Tyrosine-protein phosphatase non-receptor type 9-like isoform X2 n=1 Tax=Acanthaster planci TaxID=133434 RepID=A0A8B7ZK31_ACAPL|nr:tyrosine-protein phosphatase non-receptor type 9-like isoform X2 [Acanthaster planci]